MPCPGKLKAQPHSSCATQPHTRRPPTLSQSTKRRPCRHQCGCSRWRSNNTAPIQLPLPPFLLFLLKQQPGTPPRLSRYSARVITAATHDGGLAGGLLAWLSGLLASRPAVGAELTARSAGRRGRSARPRRRGRSARPRRSGRARGSGLAAAARSAAAAMMEIAMAHRRLRKLQDPPPPPPPPPRRDSSSSVRGPRRTLRCPHGQE